MTVEEMIQLLESYPPDLRVVVNGYEERYDDLSPEQVSVVNIQLYMGVRSWQGQHGDVRDHSQQGPSSGGSEKALVLSRLSN